VEGLFPVHLTAENLDDAWHQTVRLALMFGYRYKVDKGSYEGQDRYEFDMFTARIKKPCGPPPAYSNLVPIMPEGSGLEPPTSIEYVRDTYFPEFLYMDYKTEKEDYRYGQRILEFNQVEEVVKKFALYGEGNNQGTIEIGKPEDIVKVDPPCLRLIDCRVRYGKLHFIVYFRSWDLYAGFPANLGGLELLKQMMVGMIRDYPGSLLPNLENGEIIAVSKGLHIYEQYLEYAEARWKRTREELREEGIEKAKEIPGILIG